MDLKIVSWNVNSIRARIDSLTDLLTIERPDIIGLQETKVIDEEFPMKLFHDFDYEIIFFGQKTYNGVAIALKKNSQITVRNIIKNIPDFEDEQARCLTLRISIKETIELNFINVYIPNGSAVDSPKFDYKLSFINALLNYSQSLLRTTEHLLVMGDFNIAPTDIDVHDPKAWQGKILCSKTERNKFSEFLDLGLVDLFRHTCPHSSEYSWWDYRQGSFRRNAGLRIDHILASEKFIKTCIGAGINKDIRKHQKPSDHAPVWAKLNFSNL